MWLEPLDVFIHVLAVDQEHPIVARKLGVFRCGTREAPSYIKDGVRKRCDFCAAAIGRGGVVDVEQTVRFAILEPLKRRPITVSFVFSRSPDRLMNTFVILLPGLL